MAMELLGRMTGAATAARREMLAPHEGIGSAFAGGLMVCRGV